MVPGYHPPPTPAASPTFDVPFTPSAPPPPTASREIWRDPQFGGKIKTTSSSTVPDYSWPEVKKEPKPEFKTSFQFVVVNDDKQNARNTVRKHVMKEHRRRERWNQSLQNENEGENGSTTAARKRGRKSGKDLVPQARPSTNPPSSSETSENDSSLPSKRQRNLSSHDGLSASGSSHLEEDQPQELPYTADPLASVGASKVDPFSEFNFHDRDSRIEVNSLLHHFAWVMPSLMDEIVTGSVFHRLGWLYSCVAAHDPSPVHVILGFTLGHMANLRGMVEPVAATEHKAKALELINKRMKSPEKATSDESIGAIVNIAGYEVRLLGLTFCAFKIYD